MASEARRHLRINRDGSADTSSPFIGIWDIEARPGTTLERLKAARRSGLDAADLMRTRRSEHVASGQFTADGIKAALVKNAMSEAVSPLHRARQTIKSAKTERDELRAKVKPPATDKTDLVSAMLRAEMRDWFRSKPQSERDRISADPAKMDSQLALALMEMPAELTGVSAMHRNALIEHTVQAEHAETIATIKDLERGIELAERAVEASREEIRKDTGLERAAFDGLAAPIEKKATAPWLRKGRVIDLERGVAREPTEEEIANGIEAETLDEFNRLKAA
ncbi:hypothetical protein [Bradyrhizobium elkanii]|uniref:hypothetical protein n=1 Tax=Bradyrhizobium elkanii TaxID=29448 RepID=UPI00271510BB|nr:hypothetical protein [Bradyrhizobium elkanii]WLA52323.1 hypothetical protein QIH80_20875 [Bradyrhizobium elkanii]WLB77328.1 hypothetical protein QIH83_23320 [Bradyrhizobium elkanii]